MIPTQLSTISPPLAVSGLAVLLWGFTGAALVAIPIIIHLLNRHRFKTVTWAAMEFLLRALRKNRKRLKFEQWLLLATRCTVMGLLFLAFAWIVITSLMQQMGCSDARGGASVGGRTGMTVFVIDNSYSMAYQTGRGADGGGATHLARAKTLAKQVIDRLNPAGETVAIVTASRPAAAVIARPTHNLIEAKSAIDRIEQSAGGTDMAGALQLALQIGNETRDQPVKSLYILGDGTYSAWRTDKADAIKQTAQELAKVYKVSHHNLAAGQQQWNQASLDLRPNSSLVTNKERFNPDYTAVVKGFGAGPDGLLRWRLGQETLGEPKRLKMNEDTEAQAIGGVQFKTGGPQVMSIELADADAGNPDRLKVDNPRWRIIDVTSALRTLIVEGERGVGALDSSGAFLRMALAPLSKGGPAGTETTDSYIAPELISDLELGNKSPADLDEFAAVVLTDVGRVDPVQADRLQQFVRRGGLLMVFMGNQVNPDNYNQVLLPRKLMPGPMIKRMGTAADQPGYQFDFDPKSATMHPLLRREFYNKENTGLDTARVFGYWQVDLPPDSNVERVLNYLPADPKAAAAATTGPSASAGGAAADPAITAHSIGQGRVVFVSTSANPDTDWTTFPAKPNYVALMHELLAGSVRNDDAWLNVTVGEPLMVPASARAVSPTLVDDEGKPVLLEMYTTPENEPAYRSPPLTRPGVYRLGMGVRTVPVAVNVPDDEADVRVLANEAVREALGGIELALEGADMPSEETLSHSGSDFGWTFLFLCFLLLGVECFMAMRFGHYRRVGVVRQ